MNRQIAEKILVLILALFFTSCATTSSIPFDISNEKPSKNQAYIYIYRPYNFINSLLAAKIITNEGKLISVSNKSHILMKVPPGKYFFRPERSNSSGDVVNVQVRAGERKYVTIKAHYVSYAPLGGPLAGYGSNEFSVSEESASIAINELEKTKRQE